MADAQPEPRIAVITRSVAWVKEINDRHGHDVGDRVLSYVAQLFSDGLRTGDAVARWVATA